MSLDQILLEDIARYCPQKFLAFHQCMSRPETPEGCIKEQMELTNCVRTEVPAFQKIQGACAGKLQEYEACLTSNGHDQKKCALELLTLRECATGTL